MAKCSKRISVYTVTWVSCDVKTSIRTRQSKLETHVAALPTIPISLSAVYQLNCLLMLLNMTTFQRRRGITSTNRFIPGVIQDPLWKSAQFRGDIKWDQDVHEHGGITFWVVVLLINNGRQIFGHAKRIFINCVKNCVLILKTDHCYVFTCRSWKTSSFDFILLVWWRSIEKKS